MVKKGEKIDVAHLVSMDESCMNSATAGSNLSVVSLTPLSTRPGPMLSTIRHTNCMHVLRTATLRCLATKQWAVNILQLVRCMLCVVSSCLRNIIVRMDRLVGKCYCEQSLTYSPICKEREMYCHQTSKIVGWHDVINHCASTYPCAPIK